MKLIATEKDQEFEIKLAREDSKIVTEIDERRIELTVSNPEANVYLFKYNNKIYEVKVDIGQAGIGQYQISVGTESLLIDITDPKKLRGVGNVRGNADGIAEIKTAMPGKVVRILLEEGSEVNAGQGVIIVEAMKMQNEMKSPKDGVVKEIHFSEGDTVNAGDILVLVA